MQWRRFRVEGVIREQGSGRPLSNLTVRAFDKDLINDDHLGDAVTDANGRFEIHFTDEAFKDAIETRPDIYLSVFEHGGGEPLHDTSYAIRKNASQEEYFEIEITPENLQERN
jgi:carotenoid cleavage dioxygenase